MADAKMVEKIGYFIRKDNHALQCKGCSFTHKYSSGIKRHVENDHGAVYVGNRRGPHQLKADCYPSNGPSRSPSPQRWDKDDSFERWVSSRNQKTSVRRDSNRPRGSPERYGARSESQPGSPHSGERRRRIQRSSRADSLYEPQRHRGSKSMRPESPLSDWRPTPPPLLRESRSKLASRNLAPATQSYAPVGVNPVLGTTVGAGQAVVDDVHACEASDSVTPMIFEVQQSGPLPGPSGSTGLKMSSSDFISPEDLQAGTDSSLTMEQYNTDFQTVLYDLPTVLTNLPSVLTGLPDELANQPAVEPTPSTSSGAGQSSVSSQPPRPMESSQVKGTAMVCRIKPTPIAIVVPAEDPSSPAVAEFFIRLPGSTEIIPLRYDRSTLTHLIRSIHSYTPNITGEVDRVAVLTNLLGIAIKYAANGSAIWVVWAMTTLKHLLGDGDELVAQE